MRISIRKGLSIFLTALLVATGGLAAGASAEEPAKLRVADFFEDTVLDLTQYEGQAVLINFFTEWCPYCMEEMPDIRQVYDTYDPDSLEIILVHPWDGENADNTASVVATYGLEGVTTVEDKDFALYDAVGVPGYPTSIFIDQEGYLFYAAASKMSFDSFTQIFDAMGVPRIENGQNAAYAPATDATTGATPKK